MRPAMCRCIIIPTVHAQPLSVVCDGRTDRDRLSVGGRASTAQSRAGFATAVELRNNHSYNITPIDIQAGIRDTVWPARLELVTGTSRSRRCAAGCWPQSCGAWALRAAVSHLDHGQPLTLVFAA